MITSPSPLESWRKAKNLGGMAAESSSKEDFFRVPFWRPAAGRPGSRDEGSARPIRRKELRPLQTAESFALFRTRLARVYGHPKSRALETRCNAIANRLTAPPDPRAVIHRRIELLEIRALRPLYFAIEVGRCRL
jgi:hypothetical protein